MKKLLLGLGAIASVAAPVAAVVACGSTTDGDKSVKVTSTKTAAELSADLGNADLSTIANLHEVELLFGISTGVTQPELSAPTELKYEGGKLTFGVKHFDETKKYSFTITPKAVSSTEDLNVTMNDDADTNKQKVANIGDAFTASLDLMDKPTSGNPAISAAQKLRNFGQFVGYVSDAINNTIDGRYLLGAFRSVDDVKAINAAVGLTADKQAAAKTEFDAIGVNFKTAPGSKYFGKMQEVDGIDGSKKADLVPKLQAINATYPEVFKAALLLQIGHINIGSSIVDGSFEAHAGVHILIADAINDALAAAGYKTVDTSTIGAKEYANDADDIKTEIDKYKGQVLGFEDHTKALAALVAIAKEI